MSTHRTAAKAAAKPTAKSIYQLKITLRGSKPPIWRRVQTVGGVSLAELHDIIQVAMGWDDDHLHQFEIGGRAYGVPEDDMFGMGFDIKDESRTRLYKVAPTEGSKFDYQYDFGDDWEHAILVEKILPPEPDAQYPRCLTGRRACPPEDCGGIWGYYQLLETLENPDASDYADIREWVGADFDPEAFSVDGVNEEFAMLSTLASLRMEQSADSLLEVSATDITIDGERFVFGANEQVTRAGDAMQPLDIPLDLLGHHFTTPPLLIGDMAMTYYGLRPAGADISLVVTRADYESLAQLHPAHLKDMRGDLCVTHKPFELWTSLYRFDYNALAVDALVAGAYRVISLEKLLLLKTLGIDQAQNAVDVLLLAHRIRTQQYGKA